MATTVSVIGAGKMGLPLACLFASNGATVWACDVNPKIVAIINSGKVPFSEPGVDEMLAEQVAAGRLKATTDSATAISQSDVIIVIVPVILTADQEADLSIISSVTDTIADNLKPGAMVVYETTLPLGTTRHFGAQIEARSGKKAGVDFDLVFSPERVKSLHVLSLLVELPKIVGGINAGSAARAAKFYAEFLGAPVSNVETLEASELTKLAGMVYRDVNIALANELANYAAGWGVDFETIRAASDTGGESHILSPGIGVGGHCTPVYPHFYINDAQRRDLPFALIELGRKINKQQPATMLATLGDLKGRKVVILGLGFRPGVKEATYSPAFDLRDALLQAGAYVGLNDPLYSDEEIRGYNFLPTPIEGAEVIVLNTSHSEFRDLDFGALAGQGLKTVLDGRNLWSPEAVRAAGVVYHGVGRPAASTKELVESHS